MPSSVPFSQNRWLWLVFGLLGTGILVNVSFLILALRYPSYSIEALPYERGLQHQSVIDARVALREAGWEIRPVFHPVDLGSGLRKVSAIVTDREGRGVLGLEMRLTAIRPADISQDTKITLRDDARTGEYKAQMRLGSGAWLFRWSITHEGRSFILEERVMVP